jgi:hypothetical protein
MIGNINRLVIENDPSEFEFSDFEDEKQGLVIENDPSAFEFPNFEDRKRGLVKIINEEIVKMCDELNDNGIDIGSNSFDDILYRFARAIREELKDWREEPENCYNILKRNYKIKEMGESIEDLKRTIKNCEISIAECNERLLNESIKLQQLENK